MALINPAMITLAREWRELTQSELAARLEITQGILSKIESGLFPVPDTVASRLPMALTFPVHFFQQTDQLYGPGVGELYHRKRNSAPKKILQQLYAGINLRRMHITRLIHAAELGECKLQPHDIEEYDGKVEEIARSVRAEWLLPDGPIQNVTEALEQAGVIVIPCDFGTRLIDAMSRWIIGLPPLIFINKDLPPDRWRFTLCHEAAHLVMHRIPNPDMERQADRFAAELLMPKDQIRNMLYDINFSRLVRLKEHWKVSMAALLKRSEDLGKITARQARYLWIKMSASGIKTCEPFAELIPPEKPSSFRELIDVHLSELNYSLSELCTLLAVNPEEFDSMYNFASPPIHKNRFSLV